MHPLNKHIELFIQYLLCDTEPATTKHKRCGHGRGSMLSFLFTTVGNNLTGNSWDCLSNWFKCAFNLLFRSSCWLCKWVFYGRWWVQVFFYFPWVLIWCNDDKKKIHQKNSSSFKDNHSPLMVDSSIKQFELHRAGGNGKDFSGL